MVNFARGLPLRRPLQPTPVTLVSPLVLCCWLLVLLLLFVLLPPPPARFFFNPHCNVASCGDRMGHVLCKHPLPGPAPHCPSNTAGSQLTQSSGGTRAGPPQAEKDEVLTAHNEYRSKVACGHENLPPAADMLAMSWDPELALMAQRQADQCDRSQARCWDTRRFRVAISMGKVGHRGKDVRTLVENFYSDIEEMEPAYVDNYVPLVASSYAKMVWHNTTRVGCGRALVSAYYIFVCLYGPAGLHAGKPMYRSGPPCTACPGGKACNKIFPGLCGQVLSNASAVPVEG